MGWGALKPVKLASSLFIPCCQSTTAGTGLVKLAMLPVLLLLFISIISKFCLSLIFVSFWFYFWNLMKFHVFVSYVFLASFGSSTGIYGLFPWRFFKLLDTPTCSGGILCIAGVDKPQVNN